MAAAAHAKPNHDYHLVNPSPWPAVGSISAFIMAVGAIGWMHHMYAAAPLVFAAGVVGVIYTMISWWRDVVREARAGERAAAEAIAETGRWLGLGLASLSPLFAPDRIVVGGGVAAAGDLLLEPARASYRAHAAPEFRDRVPVVGSSFDGWEGMVGAASLFLDGA